MPDIEEVPGGNPKGPAKLTVYPASIVPGHGANDTGIYFPDKFMPGNTVDLLVYFHGLPTPCGGSNKDGVREFWSNSTFPLREMTSKSGKNVILVFPRLSLDENGLHLDMAADDFLKKVLAFIAARITKPPFKPATTSTSTTTPPADQKDVTAVSIGTLILAAHSGGGSPMLTFARQATTPKVRECWGFDSMYGGVSSWVEWAAKGGKYFLFWTIEGANNAKSAKHSPQITAMQEILSKANAPANKKGGKDPDAARAALAAPNIVIVHANKPGDASKGFATPPARTFKSSTTQHCEVPATYWDEMMKSF